MTRTVSALPLIACLILAAGSAHAQSTGFLYVGADANQQNQAFGTATVSASGTAATGQFAFINADPSTTSYEGVSAFSNAQVTITGGTFQQLLADNTSVINLVGYNLTQSKSFYFDNTGLSWYTVSGTLAQDQTPFTAQWYRPSSGTLEFNGAPAIPGGAPAVPEASTLVSFGLLLFGAALLAFKRRTVTA